MLLQVMDGGGQIDISEPLAQVDLHGKSEFLRFSILRFLVDIEVLHCAFHFGSPSFSIAAIVSFGIRQVVLCAPGIWTAGTRPNLHFFRNVL